MSKDYTPGERVRVVIEATITANRDHLFYIGADDEGRALYAEAKDIVSVERLTEPEPEWKPGDVVLRDVAGRNPNVATYLGDDRWFHVYPWGGHGYMSTEQVRRGNPIPVVRDGKPVQS